MKRNCRLAEEHDLFGYARFGNGRQKYALQIRRPRKELDYTRNKCRLIAARESLLEFLQHAMTLEADTRLDSVGTGTINNFGKINMIPSLCSFCSLSLLVSREKG